MLSILGRLSSPRPTISVGTITDPHPLELSDAEQPSKRDSEPVKRQKIPPSPFSIIFTSQVVTAASNFGVQYNYTAIGVALVWIHQLFGEFEWADSLCKIAVFVGTLVGMTFFGCVGDLIGRSKAMVVTLTVMAAAAFLSGFLPMGSDNSVYAILIACRLCIGIGAGGVYPLAAAKASEDCVDPDINKKAQAAAWAFFWRNPGQIWVYLLAIIIAWCLGVPSESDTQLDPAVYKSSLAFQEGGLSIFVGKWDLAWRIYLASGCIAPAIVAIAAYYELRASQLEEDRVPDRAPSRRGPRTSVEPPPPFSRASSMIGVESTSLINKIKASNPARPFLATGGGWLLFDFGFYGNAMMQPRVTQIVLPDVRGFMDKALVAMAISSVGIAFTLVVLPLIPRLGLRNLQISGFILNAALSLALGSAWGPLHTASTANDENSGVATAALVILYTLLLGSYWICNVTTYILPTAVFEADVRSTMHGASAACGKIGAIAGTYIFAYILHTAVDKDKAILAVLHACATAALLGAVVTWFGTSKPVDGEAPARGRRRATPMV